MRLQILRDLGALFVTAGVAFIGAGIIVFLMHVGGHWVMFALVILTVFLLIRSNRRFKEKASEESGDTLFQTILSTQDKEQTWNLLMLYIKEQQSKFLIFASESYASMTEAFVKDDAKTLGKLDKVLFETKNTLKSTRRKETLCLRRVSHEVAIEKSAWFHLANNCCMEMLYNLRRINETCKEHVDNNFRPLPKQYVERFMEIRTSISILFNDTLQMMDTPESELIRVLRRHCDEIKDTISETYHGMQNQLREGDAKSMTVLYVYINTLQETQEMVSVLRKYLRAYAKLQDSQFSSYPRVTPNFQNN